MQLERFTHRCNKTQGDKIMNKDERINQLSIEVDYYRTELAKAHEILGRVTHQLSERWDTVRLTQYYPTNNLHGRRSISNPMGKKV